jgi:alpha-N-arabinofuranosidase
MQYSRVLFFLSQLILVIAGTSSAQPVTATIDATRTGQPISRLIFGGFMEPATTSVWAEMLADRKFLSEITSKASSAPAGWISFMRPQRRWGPIGADSFVTMDKTNPYVGEWSPLVRLETGTPHGISQSRIVLVGGRTYTGRVILKGTPGAKVSVSLIWGQNAGDRQTITTEKLTSAYARFPLKFIPKSDTNEGRFEIEGIG